MGSVAEPRFCAMGGQCTQARFLSGKPAKLRTTSNSKVCARCEESGLSPDDVTARPLTLLPSVEGEENKVRAFKAGLTIQLYVQKGPFWEAVGGMREKRNIVAERRLPPSGPEISGLILPEARYKGQDYFELSDEWCSDIRIVQEHCIPSWLQDSAEWEHFIAACILFDPPHRQLEEFTQHGDPRYFDPTKPGAKGGRVPLQARASIRLLATDERDLEEVHLWLAERLLEEVGKRYLKPVGIDVEAAIEQIFNDTNLSNEYTQKKREVRRQWHIAVETGTPKDDINKAFSLIPDARKGRPRSGGRSSRNPLRALQCAILHERYGWKYERIAAHYGWENAGSNVVSKYVAEGRRMLAE